MKRFWDKVNKTDNCWLWTAAIDSHGYGKIIIGSRSDKSRKYRIASRVSWELINGPIPFKKLVLHKCDNPLCVNPDHLFLGTSGDNNRDRHRKGRTRGCCAK